MKVLHVIRGLANSSGTTHIVGPLAEEQARRGCNVSVYCVAKGREPPTVPNQDLVDSRCFPCTLPLDNPGVSPGIAAALSRNIREFDVVHVHAIWNFPSWWAMRSAYRARVPYIVAPQGSLDPWALQQNAWGKKLYGVLTEVPLLNRANRLQALTHKEAAQFHQYGIHAQAAIIPNGIGSELLRRHRKREPGQFGLPEDCRTLLFLSRVHPKKGIDYLVNAVAAIRAEFPDLRVVVAGSDGGSGYLNKIRQRCGRLGVDDLFIFLGEVQGREKQDVLTAADAFILPSRSEGLPVAALEALGSGLPVIVTDQCNIPEVQRFNAGLVVLPEIKEIASAIVRIFSLTHDEREAIGGNARELASKQFTWERIAQRTIDCYRTMIEERAAS